MRRGRARDGQGTDGNVLCHTRPGLQGTDPGEKQSWPTPTCQVLAARRTAEINCPPSGALRPHTLQWSPDSGQMSKKTSLGGKQRTTKEEAAGGAAGNQPSTCAKGTQDGDEDRDGTKSSWCSKWQRKMLSSRERREAFQISPLPRSRPPPRGPLCRLQGRTSYILSQPTCHSRAGRRGTFSNLQISVTFPR